MASRDDACWYELAQWGDPALCVVKVPNIDDSDDVSNLQDQSLRTRLHLDVYRQRRREHESLTKEKEYYHERGENGEKLSRILCAPDLGGGERASANTCIALAVLERYRKKPNLWLAHGAKLSRLSMDLQLFDINQAHKVPSWHSGSPVPEKGVYLNRVASIHTGIAVASHHGSKLYTTDDQATEWKTWFVDDDVVITNLASLNGECYSVMEQQTSTSSKVARFDIKTGTWHPFLTFKGKMKLAANENDLFLIGNAEGLVDDEMQIYKCDVGGMQERMCSIPIRPSQFSAVAIGEKIYLAGTHDLSSFTCCLNLGDFSLTNLPNTTNRNCTLVDFGGRLVASGGIDESKRGISAASDRVEIFQPEFDQEWLPLLPMVHKRVLHGVCITNDYSLAVVGGMDLDTLSSVELFQLQL